MISLGGGGVKVGRGGEGLSYIGKKVLNCRLYKGTFRSKKISLFFLLINKLKLK